MLQDSETVAKKIQLPPQATVAVFDEKDQTIKMMQEHERPMPFENHTPMWTKHGATQSHFHKKSHSVQ